MSKQILFIAIFLIISTSPFAHTVGDSTATVLPPNQRFYTSHYQAGTWMIGGFPQLGIVISSEGDNIYAAGAALELGYFFLDRFLVTLDASYQKVWYTYNPEINRQYFAPQFLYFFSDKKKITPFAGVRPFVLRFQYQPTEILNYLNDEPSSERKTHLITGIKIPVGLSWKLTRKFSLHTGLGFRTTFNTPKHTKNPEPGYIDFSLRIRYHL